jgi:hypothetical protein
MEQARINMHFVTAAAHPANTSEDSVHTYNGLTSARHGFGIRSIGAPSHLVNLSWTIER